MTIQNFENYNPKSINSYIELELIVIVENLKLNLVIYAQIIHFIKEFYN